MPFFSATSRQRLDTCDPVLRVVFDEVIKHFDCTIICGHRTKEAQSEAFESGHSQVQWPNSRHNTAPSKAVDAAPFPIDWGDRERQTLFAGRVLGVAQALGHKLRWGGDWNMDGRTIDNKFDDLVHFEVVE
jgi:hypothetical protein